MKEDKKKGRRTTHKEFLEKVDRVFPDREWKIIDRYSFNKTPIRVEDKYGVCKISPNSIMQGSVPSIKSAVNKTKYTIARFEELWGKNKFDYSEFEYKGTVTPSTIICKKRGHKFEMRPNNHLGGQGCPRCGKKRASKTLYSNTAKFVEKARECHGDKYGYEKVDYRSAKEGVEIFCPDHGFFTQIPNTHLSGSGCPKCGNKRGGLINFRAASEGRMCTLYLVECWDDEERFLKVGITSLSVEERFKSGMPYKYKTLNTFLDKCPDSVQKAEKLLLNMFEDLSYKPKIFFKGHTECLNIGAKQQTNKKVEELKENSKKFLSFVGNKEEKENNKLVAQIK